jgi:undecaprenyl-diphosphatase
MPPALLEAAALGAVQGATELLPVSSSAHVAALPWLLGWSVAEWDPERHKELEVALHTGALAALAPTLWRARPDLRTLALALAPPAVAGYAFEDAIQRRLSGPLPLAAGLTAGAIALAWADRAPQRRRPAAGVGDALVLGLAQAAALAPGVSRTGATLAAARARGFGREEASALSFGVAGPVLAGATALKAWRLRSAPAGHARVVGVGAACAFAATALAQRILGTRRREPLWPYAAERVALAGGILALRYRRSR